MGFLLEIIRLGLSNLRRHLLRSVLTALGIILGVAAVIANGGIGEGAKREALAQLERLGAKNIIVRSQQPPETAQSGGGQQRGWVSRFGLTRSDLRVLQEQFPDLEAVVPLKEVGSQIIRGSLRRTSQAYGTTPELLTVANLSVERGRYLTEADQTGRESVAVIGAEIARLFFASDEDPLGDTIRIDGKSFRIVGILEPVGFAGGKGATQLGRDLNLDIHIPLSTSEELFGDLIARNSSGNRQMNSVQISEIYFVARSRETVIQTAELIRRAVEVRRPGLADVAVIVPYELLEEARKTAAIWQLVLGAIAGISLLVGGIGIMNIMLASVTERTREIGIRRALGATRKHIVWQFLVETGVLSVIGGLLGVAVGVGLTTFIGFIVKTAHRVPMIGGLFPSTINLPTAVTLSSIILAFSVATLVGIIFGLYPAIKASRQDPIEALRHT
jgi:putative ABC transport system permease protein